MQRFGDKLMNKSFEEEIQRGRTFAIISHPDAGKTTLTEKLLLFGGAIREAGAVKARRDRLHARSDWMEIEQQRGISVTSTVLQFEYKGYRVNLLDTPGHQDFSEDTYRTLLAADSVVMVIDAAKGIEAQTLKLFQVAKERQIPIFTFINKLDRESRDPWDLMEEIDRTLKMRTYPVTWPVGMGPGFQGLFNRETKQFEKFDRQSRHFESFDISQAQLDNHYVRELEGSLELLDGAGEPLDNEAILRGEQSPVFFGSAIANFGIETFLNFYLLLAPGPTARPTTTGTLAPETPEFSGFVFKIQANMNPQHRDRVAFVRVASGEFSRGMAVTHSRSGRQIRLNQPQQFLAQDRAIVEKAYPGDIIGLHDSGLLSIGDSLSESGRIEFSGFPRFSPEHFAEIELKYTLKHKQFLRGLSELTEEGLIQMYRPIDQGPQVFLGVVGPLQFEVLQYRLSHEYGVEIDVRPLGYNLARWVVNDVTIEIGRFDRAKLVLDSRQQKVLFLEDERTLDRLREKHPDLVVSETSP